MSNRWDKYGVMTSDAKASDALRGIPPGVIADKMELFEKHVCDYLADAHGTPWGRFSIWCLRELLKVYRSETYELAVAYSKQLNDQRAATAQADFYQQYLRMVQENREMRSFFWNHFGAELLEAETENITLSALARRLLLRYRYPDGKIPDPKQELDNLAKGIR